MTTGILLINLGSPDSTDVADVRRYLAQFLDDPLVIDTPWLLRQLLLRLVILPRRPKESAHAYSEIWTDKGSPLVVTTQALRDLVANEIADMPIEIAMRYGNPSIEKGVVDLAKQGADHILVVPLYPHYAMSSYETVVAEVRRVIEARDGRPTVDFLPPFYDDDDYVSALVHVAQPYLDSEWDHLLFSYHGIPERHVLKRDPTGCYCLKTPNCCEQPSPAHAFCYRAQVHTTTFRFVEKAGLPDDKWSISFQSRLGRDPWLKPYTDFELTRLARQGVEDLLVICPAFVADCLETLEEIQMRGKEDFLAAGGRSFRMIPCLNTDKAWVGALTKLITGRLA